MCAVTLLPKELGGAEEHAGAHLPAHHVCPLVAEYWEVAVGVDPVAVCAPDDGLGCRTYDQLLLQTCVGIDDHAVAVGVVLEAVVGHYRAFFRESFHMLGFTAKE